MSIFAHCKHHRIDQGRTVRTPGKKVSKQHRDRQQPVHLLLRSQGAAMTNPYIIPLGFQEAAIQSVNDQVSTSQPGPPSAKKPPEAALSGVLRQLWPPSDPSANSP